MSGDELALLGHLIGDGCTLPRHSIQYTTNDRGLAETVSEAASRVFGSSVNPRIVRERQWWQVYLPSTRKLARGVRNPITTWLEGMDAFGWRSHEKRIPLRVFQQPSENIAKFLRHLWSTDGCVWLAKSGGGPPRIYYASSSERLARDVQSLLLRIGINSTLRHATTKERGQWHVDVGGMPNTIAFLRRVGALGETRTSAILGRIAESGGANTNQDVIPKQAWSAFVKPAMATAGLTTRSMQQAIGTQYCGSTLYKANLSRERASRVAEAVGSQGLSILAQSDLYWDRIVSIEPDGVEEVYDLTVADHHNFVAEDIVVHNSIEQDADIVSFIYRDEYYNDETERPGEADLVIAKHRNGPIGTIPLAFQAQFPRFLNLAGSYGGDERGEEAA